MITIVSVKLIEGTLAGDVIFVADFLSLLDRYRSIVEFVHIRNRKLVSVDSATYLLKRKMKEMSFLNDTKLLNNMYNRVIGRMLLISIGDSYPKIKRKVDIDYSYRYSI